MDKSTENTIKALNELNHFLKQGEITSKIPDNINAKTPVDLKVDDLNEVPVQYREEVLRQLEIFKKLVKKQDLVLLAREVAVAWVNKTGIKFDDAMNIIFSMLCALEVSGKTKFLDGDGKINLGETIQN